MCVSRCVYEQVCVCRCVQVCVGECELVWVCWRVHVGCVGECLISMIVRPGSNVSMIHGECTEMLIQ